MVQHINTLNTQIFLIIYLLFLIFQLMRLHERNDESIKENNTVRLQLNEASIVFFSYCLNLGRIFLRYISSYRLYLHVCIILSIFIKNSSLLVVINNT